MIGTAFYFLIAAFLTGFSQLLSNDPVVYPAIMQSSWNLIVNTSLGWNALVPVFHMFAALTIFVVASTFLLAWKGVQWVLQLIRG